jgi:hypothetical protein
MKDESHMKKFLPLALLLAPAVLFANDADDSVVKWQQIVGVITAPNVDNPVAGISSGTLPWSVRAGHARVNLSTGEVSFDVDGLVLNGGDASGTTGPITGVTGTLVCNPGTKVQKALNTPEVKLTVHGDADFYGQISGIPAACANPLFLVRIGPSFGIAGAVGRWIATGAIPTMGD